MHLLIRQNQFPLPEASGCIPGNHKYIVMKKFTMRSVLQLTILLVFNLHRMQKGGHGKFAGHR